MCIVYSFVGIPAVYFDYYYWIIVDLYDHMTTTDLKTYGIQPPPGPLATSPLYKFRKSHETHIADTIVMRRGERWPVRVGEVPWERINRNVFLPSLNRHNRKIVSISQVTSRRSIYRVSPVAYLRVVVCRMIHHPPKPFFLKLEPQP